MMCLLNAKVLQDPFKKIHTLWVCYAKVLCVCISRMFTTHLKKYQQINNFNIHFS